MKTTAASLLVVLLITATQLSAQKKITVEAQNDDISYNLDLKAVASVFADSRNLEEFEMKLNDYDSQISNLDLNNDGEVDYLRVIETSERNVHVVVIQAVLDRDVFQDVATIVVDRNKSNRTYVHIIGDPYIYGNNYIIDPVFYRTPSIFSFFWGSSYSTWYSPYYWGYYPTYYSYRRPYTVNIYLSNVNRYVNPRYDYHYSDYRRNDYTTRLYNTISRNDYSRTYPDRTFTQRNINVYNKKEFESKNTVPSRSGGISRYENSIKTESRSDQKSNTTRNTSPTWTGGAVERNSTTNETRKPVSNNQTPISRPTDNVSRNPGNSYSAPINNTRTNEGRVTTQAPVVNRPAPSVSRDNGNSRPTQSVRNEKATVSKPIERTSGEVRVQDKKSTENNNGSTRR